MTGTVLIMTNSWTGDLAGAYITSYAFSTALAEAGNYIVTVGLIFFAFTTILEWRLIFFAFTTILEWNYYGERCTEFLVGVKRILPYRISLHPDCCVRCLPEPGCNLDTCRYA